MTRLSGFFPQPPCSVLEGQGTRGLAHLSLFMAMEKIKLISFLYPFLTVIVTVVLVAAIRGFGKLPVASMGPDLNLLTYGFLWDTAVKVLRGQPYWESFEPLIPGVNKLTTLFIIALLNLVLLGLNLKLAHHVEKMTSGALKKLVGMPFVNALGCVSLVIFLWAQGIWDEPPKQAPGQGSKPETSAVTPK